MDVVKQKKASNKVETTASKQQWLRVKNKIKQQDNHEYNCTLKSLFKELTQKHMV